MSFQGYLNTIKAKTGIEIKRQQIDLQHAFFQP